MLRLAITPSKVRTIRAHCCAIRMDEEKPGDAAIHVRLGRVLEKLGRLPEAMGQYKEALDAAGPPKWSDEAEAGVIRLQQHSPR